LRVPIPAQFDRARSTGPTSRCDGPSHGGLLRQDHTALRALLDRHAGARDRMRHLAYLEHALGRHGSRAMKRVPTRVLAEALAQLDNLLQATGLGGFDELRARLRSIVGSRTTVAGELDALPSVDVSEASHSLFDEMERSWSGRTPAPVPVTHGGS
jgi:hypothetical protein